MSSSKEHSKISTLNTIMKTDRYQYMLPAVSNGLNFFVSFYSSETSRSFQNKEASAHSTEDIERRRLANRTRKLVCKKFLEAI